MTVGPDFHLQLYVTGSHESHNTNHESPISKRLSKLRGANELIN